MAPKRLSWSSMVLKVQYTFTQARLCENREGIYYFLLVENGNEITTAGYLRYNGDSTSP